MVSMSVCGGVSQACVSRSTFLWYLWHRFTLMSVSHRVRGQEIKETPHIHTCIRSFQDGLFVLLWKLHSHECVRDTTVCDL